MQDRRLAAALSNEGVIENVVELIESSTRTRGIRLPPHCWARPPGSPRGANTMSTHPSILVTGGAGFLGINLCRHLLARNRVRSMDIADFDYPERDKSMSCGRIFAIRPRSNARWRGWTSWSIARRRCRSRAGRRSSRPMSAERRLCSRARRDTPVARFIYISSTSVYGIPDHHPVYEHDRLQGVGPYGAAKIAAEQLCLEARTKGRAFPFCAPKASWGPSGWEFSSCSTIGPMRAGISPCWARDRIVTSCSMWRIFARSSPVRDTRNTGGQRHLQRGRQGVRHDAR